MLDLFGAFFGISGTLLILLPNKYHKYAWTSWILGAMVWTIVGILNHLMGLVLLSIVYLVLDSVGLYKTLKNVDKSKISAIL